MTKTRVHERRGAWHIVKLVLKSKTTRRRIGLPKTNTYYDWLFIRSYKVTLLNLKCFSLPRLSELVHERLYSSSSKALRLNSLCWFVGNISKSTYFKVWYHVSAFAYAIFSVMRVLLLWRYFCCFIVLFFF